MLQVLTRKIVMAVVVAEPRPPWPDVPDCMQLPPMTSIAVGTEVKAAEDAMVIDALLEPARAAGAVKMIEKVADAEAPTVAGVAAIVPTEPDGVPIV